jgi:hypothetical protein
MHTIYTSLEEPLTVHNIGDKKERYERILARTEPESIDIKTTWLGTMLGKEEY